jgi:hypothetical protein
VAVSRSSTSTAITNPPSKKPPTQGSGPTATGPMCRDGQITVTALDAGAGTGTVYQVFGFVNTSTAACTLMGYPGVAALNAQGLQVAQAQRKLTGVGGVQNGSSTPPSVTLNPGQIASAMISGNSHPTGAATSCPFYAPSFLITPPNVTQPIKVAAGSMWQAIGFPGCSGLTVYPVVPGMTGSLS